MRLGNILDKVTPEYAVWRAQEIEDKVMLLARMRVLVTDFEKSQKNGKIRPKNRNIKFRGWKRIIAR